MAQIQLGRADYRDKVLACWLGKNIGGTLGAPVETQKHMHDLTFYDPVPTEPLPNDDLDFQIVWLKMLEDEGISPPLPVFADYWVRYLSAYPWNEYGFCRRNLARGLMPPISGCFENYFVDEMGSPIRSEIWACTAPADPQLAAARAWKDSALDHAGGEGTHGEMFWAAVESAAFIEDDPLSLIRVGLAMIPVPCAISRVIREAVWCHRNGLRWADARQRIVDVFGHRQPCNAVPNHGFTILGWLYGEDFGDRLCKAVNCGYDTDCTGATLGSVLGIIGGTAAIPAKWREPVGESIVLHKFTGEFNAPLDVEELTERTAAIAERVVADLSDSVAFGDATIPPENVLSLLSRNEKAQGALRQDVHAAVATAAGLEITLHYGGEPVLYPGLARIFRVSLRQDGKPVRRDVSLSASPGWTVTPVDGDDRTAFEVTAPELERFNDIEVAVLHDGTAAQRATFRVLGPQEAQGFPAAENLPRCPECQGLEGYCICARD
ncbi:MAG: ADP-ribosylglycohydrolase family protein [Candidatus Brocadiae bacterium]|nr:ADP-ribosylglycohydrolase family protein [Candidatus Brocadiia bacterium]